MRSLLARVNHRNRGIAGVVAILAAYAVPPFAAFLLIVAGFTLLLDAITGWYAKATGGGLREYKQ